MELDDESVDHYDLTMQVLSGTILLNLHCFVTFSTNPNMLLQTIKLSEPNSRCQIFYNNLQKT